MTGRKCSTCKHFEAAPIWRRGWCRNPLLYSPQQSHLVSEDDLDCERGMGNYWEPAPDQPMAAPADIPVSQDNPPAIPLTPVATRGGQPIFPVSGSSGYGNDQPEPPPGAGGRGGSSSGGGPLNYYSEDRYWTDWLRIAAPILGVLLLVVLFWLWASSFLGGDDDNSTAGLATGTTTLPTIGPTATSGSGSGTPASGTPTSPIVITTVTPPAGSTPTQGIVTEPTPTEGAPSNGGGEIYAGATVQIANTGGDGANLRTDPSSAGEIVTTLLDGTTGTTTGEAVEADGLVWWPITTDEGDGYVAADFLVLVE